MTLAKSRTHPATNPALALRYRWTWQMLLLGVITALSLSFARSARASDTSAPRVQGSYIAALIVKAQDHNEAGLVRDNLSATLSQPSRFLQFSQEVFATSSLAAAPRFLGTLSNAPRSPSHRTSGSSGNEDAEIETWALVRVDFSDHTLSGQELAVQQLEALVAEGKLAYFEPNYLSKPYHSSAKAEAKQNTHVSEGANPTFGDVLPRYEDYLKADCSGEGTECHLRYEQIRLTEALRAIKDTPLDQAPVIAVMDSGVDYEHPALEGRLWQNSPEQQGISGCSEDIYGCDTTQSSDGLLGHGETIYPTGTDGPDLSCPPISEQGGNCIHGTHIAGIISATTAVISGFAYPGICPSCKVLSVKIVGPTKDGSNTGEYSIADSSIIAGLSYIENFSRKVTPVKIVNASFGKFHASRTVEALLRRLQGKGTLFVAATGNESTEKPSYPAAFDDVIAVANISKRTRAKHENSNYGPWVDISAPGSGLSGIFSTRPGGNYISLIGTSMAAPMVAAVAGLVWANNPELKASEVADRILSGADSSMYEVPENSPYLLTSSGLKQPLLGRGSLNAYNAVTGTRGNNLSTRSRDLPPACGTIHGLPNHEPFAPLWWLLYLLPLFAILSFRTHHTRVP